MDLDSVYVLTFSPSIFIIRCLLSHSGPTVGNLAKMKFFQTPNIRHVKKAEILGYSKLFKFFVYLFSTKIYISLKMNKFVMKGKYWKICEISQTC